MHNPTLKAAYVRLVQSGRWTMDDIPAAYQAAVAAEIKAAQPPTAPAPAPAPATEEE